jgi:hypothetical protein
LERGPPYPAQPLVGFSGQTSFFGLLHLAPLSQLAGTATWEAALQMDIVVKSLHDRHFGTPVPLFKRLGGRLIPKNSVFLRRIEKVGLAPKRS